MSELRSALPYFSTIRLTVLPTEQVVPSGLYNQQTGEELGRQVTMMPGLQLEIIPLMGNIAAGAQPAFYPSRGFAEEHLATLQKPVAAIEAIEAIAEADRTPEQKQVLAKLKATLESAKPQIDEVTTWLARTDITWVEELLEMGQLPSLGDLFSDAFSDVLDTFSSWNEAANSAGGIPVSIKCMQWNVQFPLQGAKSINVKVGVFCGKAAPQIYELVFEDSVTSNQRLQTIAQIASAIQQRQTTLAGLEDDDPQVAQITSELVGLTAEKDRLEALELGHLDDVTSKPSVRAAIPKLLVAAIKALQKTTWPTLDVPLAATKLQERLTAIFPAQQTPPA